MNITVAVDANGADLGPSEVAEGAAEAAAQGVRVLLYGPADEMGPVARGRRGGRRPGVDREGGRPRRGGALDPRRLDRPRGAGGRRGRGRRVRLRRVDRPRARRGPLQHPPRPRHPPARARDPGARPRPPGDHRRRRRERGGAARAPRAVRLHGRGARRDDPRGRPPPGRPALDRRGGHEGHAARRRGARRAARPRRRGRHVRLRREHRGQRDPVRAVRRHRHRRLHGQRRPEAHGGRLRGDAAQHPRASPSRRGGRRRAGSCCARRCSSSAT